MSRKVGSEEWGHSVPSTCDWRKAGTISPVRDQVSASTPSPAAWPNPARGGGWRGARGEAGRRGPAVLTRPHHYHPFTISNTATVAGPSRQQATSRPYGPSSSISLWRSPCSVRLGAGAGGRGRRGCLRPGHTHCPFWHQSWLTVTAVGTAARVALSGMRSSLSSTTVSTRLLWALVAGGGWGGYCSRAELSFLPGLAYL